MKRQVRELEVQNLEWREKFKYSSARNNDLTHQVEYVEKDMQRIAKEAGTQQAFATFQGEQMSRRDEEQERAFVDIKSMISQYRRDRNGQSPIRDGSTKENK